MQRENVVVFVHPATLPGPAVGWMPSLLALAEPGHVLFGSDLPFAPEIVVQWFATQLDAYGGFDDAGHRAVDRAHAEALFPKFIHTEELP